MPCSPWEFAGVSVACLGYFIILVMTRWFMVASPDRELLREHIQRVRTELEEQAGGMTPRRSLDAITELLNATERTLEHKWYYVWLWSGAYESSGWYRIHDAKLRMAAYWPWPETKVRLQAAVHELRQPSKLWEKQADALATEIERFLREEAQGRTPAEDPLPLARSLLHRALRIAYSREGFEDQEVRYWHNRIMWMSICSLGVIVVLTFYFGQAELFLLGVLGSLLSRLFLMRAPDDSNTQSIYWTSLFISPLIGAMTGWAGVLVAHLLVEQKLLGTDFMDVTWRECKPPTHASLAVAFLCGLSERFFNSIIARRIDTAAKSVSHSQAAPAGAPKDGPDSQ